MKAIFYNSFERELFVIECNNEAELWAAHDDIAHMFDDDNMLQPLDSLETISLDRFKELVKEQEFVYNFKGRHKHEKKV